MNNRRHMAFTKLYAAILVGIYSLLLTMTASAVGNPGQEIARQIKVFKYDQSTQCNNDGIPLKEMKQELTDAGIQVYCAQKGNDGNPYLAVCGGATGNINIYLIGISDLRLAQRLGFAPVRTLENYRDQPCKQHPPKVFKYDQSTQCNNDGIPLEVMERELIEAGIDVKCSQKANDGMMYPAVCGGGTGDINVYLIQPENIPDAAQLGFQHVTELTEYQDQPCQSVGVEK